MYTDNILILSIVVMIDLSLLIIIIVMAANISRVKKDVQSLRKDIKDRLPVNRVCGNCKGEFQGVHPKCPHCDIKINY